MTSPTKLLAAGTAALTLAGGAAAATAKPAHHPPKHLRRVAVKAAVAYLGVDRKTIRADLKRGQTLSRIANAQAGKSAAGLEQAITTAVKAKLDARVAAGKLAADREARILARLQTRLDKLVNRVFAKS
jgi:hypothetical protein